MYLIAVFFALLSKVLANVEVTIDGNVFESFGLEGYGFVPADAVDKYDETISIGSSVAYQDVSVDEDGVYHFTAYCLPDRGYNIVGTVNTLSRIHKYSVDFTPMEESSTPNIIWNYEDTILLKDMNGNSFTGLDSNTSVTWNGLEIPAVTYHGDGWGNGLNSSSTTTALCMDSEGLVLIDGDIDNGFWISDEYGPSLFKFDGSGNMVDYIQAPDAILPHTEEEINFSSDSSPGWDLSFVPEENDSGREPNHGYEAVDFSPDGKYLYAALQAATVQDGGDKSKYSMNTRLLKYDISVSPYQLVAEYAIVLPTYTTADGSLKTASQSEMRVLSEDIVMLLPRDSDLGNGGADGTQAIFKHVDIWSLKDADNIVGLYDSLGDKIASSKGVLKTSITPATHYSFIDLLDPTELAKFNLHNGGAEDSMLINEKWEGMTLIPKQCTDDEFYLLLVSDNDFQTTNGFMNDGTITYDAGINIDSQSLIFHVKLPVLTHEDDECPGSSSSAAASSASSASSVSSSASVLISSSATVSSSAPSSSSVSSSEFLSSATDSQLTSSAPSSVPDSQVTSSASSSAPNSQVTSSASSSAPNSQVTSSAPSSAPDSQVTSSASSSAFSLDTLATPVYIWSGASTSTETLTYVDGTISVPVGGLFKRDDATLSQTVVLVPTPTAIGWTGTYTATTVVQMTELLNNGQLVLTDVTLLETPTVTSEPSEVISSSIQSSSSSNATGSASANSYTTITTVVDGVTETVTIPCDSTSAESYTTITTIVDGVTETVTIPCDSTSAESYTTITTIVDGVTETVTIPCDSTSAESYTTITTVVDGVTKTVTVPCESNTTTLETSSVTTQATSTSGAENTTEAGESTFTKNAPNTVPTSTITENTAKTTSSVSSTEASTEKTLRTSTSSTKTEAGETTFSTFTAGAIIAQAGILSPLALAIAAFFI